MNLDILESPNYSEDSNFQALSRHTHSVSEQQSHRVWKSNEKDDESIADRQALLQFMSKNTSKCQSGPQSRMSSIELKRRMKMPPDILANSKKIQQEKQNK